MARVFIRKWKVIVGDLSTELLRVRFKITKTLEKEPNTCDLKITNLSESSRGKLRGAGLPVIIEAGYEDEIATIFSGDSRTVDHVQETSDWTTHVQCGDGEQVYQYARINESFSPGTRLSDVIRTAAKKLSLNPGNLEDALAQPLAFESFTQGVACFGRASEVFDRFVRAAGYTWSVQQGAIQVVKAGQPVQSLAYRIAPDSGLIGSPEHTPPDKKGKPSTLKLRCFLNPRIRPASIIVVDSAAVKGEFVIQKLTHSGDSHANDWFSEIEAVARQ